MLKPNAKLSDNLYALKHRRQPGKIIPTTEVHPLRSWAQTVRDMTEKEIREEFVAIVEKRSSQPKSVRDFIHQLIHWDYMHSQIQAKKRRAKRAAKTKETS